MTIEYNCIECHFACSKILHVSIKYPFKQLLINSTNWQNLSRCIEGSLAVSISRKEGRLAAEFKGGVICPSQLLPQMANSLSPGSCGSDCKSLMFRLIIPNSHFGACCGITLGWMPQHIFSDKSTLVQVMAWCCLASKPCLNQCWPRFKSPYVITCHSELISNFTIIDIYTPPPPPPKKKKKCVEYEWCPITCHLSNLFQFFSSSDCQNLMKIPFISSPLIDAYMCQWIRSALVQIMACHLFGAKPSSKPMLGYCQLDP